VHTSRRCCLASACSCVVLRSPVDTSALDQPCVVPRPAREERRGDALPGGARFRAATSRCTRQSRLADRVTHPPVGMHEPGRDGRIPARAPRGRVARGGEAEKPPRSLSRLRLIIIAAAAGGGDASESRGSNAPVSRCGVEWSAVRFSLLVHATYEPAVPCKIAGLVFAVGRARYVVRDPPARFEVTATVLQLLLRIHCSPRTAAVFSHPFLTTKSKII
jgi:hypothetical protein